MLTLSAVCGHSACARLFSVDVGRDQLTGIDVSALVPTGWTTRGDDLDTAAVRCPLHPLDETDLYEIYEGESTHLLLITSDRIAADTARESGDTVVQRRWAPTE